MIKNFELYELYEEKKNADEERALLRVQYEEAIHWANATHAAMEQAEAARNEAKRGLVRACHNGVWECASVMGEELRKMQGEIVAVSAGIRRIKKEIDTALERDDYDKVIELRSHLKKYEARRSELMREMRAEVKERIIGGEKVMLEDTNSDLMLKMLQRVYEETDEAYRKAAEEFEIARVRRNELSIDYKESVEGSLFCAKMYAERMEELKCLIWCYLPKEYWCDRCEIIETADKTEIWYGYDGKEYRKFMTIDVKTGRKEEYVDSDTVIMRMLNPSRPVSLWEKVKRLWNYVVDKVKRVVTEEEYAR